MKPKIIELKQAPVILVELPYHPMQIFDSLDRTKIHYRNEVLGDWITIKNIPEFDSILGILSDLTEEQFAECVCWYDYYHADDLTALYAFKDYVNGVEEAYDYWDEYCFDTAKASFYSLLESENVYTENPFGAEPTPENTANYAYSIHARQWEQTQSRTIDPERTVVLLRKEGKK